MAGALRFACLPLVFAATLGCAPEFDKVSELQTLRILAVQKDKPYARPGETVTLSMLWRDATEKAGRSVQVQWLTGCNNPAGDLYFSCLASPLVPAVPVFCPDPSGQPCNNKLELPIPSNILDRPPSSDPTQPPYGLSFVFYAICAGTLGEVPGATEREFKLGCFDGQGNRLGSDDFVAGYSAIYAYGDTLVNGREITNNNPPVLGFFFKDSEVTQRCLGDECLNLPDWSSFDCDSGVVPCVDTCEHDGDESCPPHKIRPKLVESESDLPAYPEEDVVSNATRERNIREQMWINYYTEKVSPRTPGNGGGVKSEVRLLNDAFSGTNDDYGTEFYAPKEPGVTVIWAVVHDNRGGMSWVGMPVIVRKP